ncbi:hypothetical protein BGW38_010658, partial [Lunasporangiospora selenospora]
GIFDLFSTLMVSLPIEEHKLLFKKYPNSFTADEAIANLRGLQFIQSNRDTDPNDPTRIITHVVTTQFSLPRDMAKNLCQTFMDARLFECATDLNKREFQNKGIYQVTGKGAYILAKFVHRNSLPVDETRHITSNAVPNLVYLERAEDEDAIVLTTMHLDMIFKRFAGPEPNIAKPTVSPGDSPLSSSPNGRERVQSVTELCNGIEVKDQQHNYDMYKHTFYGKAAVEWLMDYTTVIGKEEAICIAQEMVTVGYIEQIGEENRVGPHLFKTGNGALYHLTEAGRAVVGWKSLIASSRSSINNDWMDGGSIVGPKQERLSTDQKQLSAQFKMASNNLTRLPISIVREPRRSLDEHHSAVSVCGTGACTTSMALTGQQLIEETGRSIRRLSQILNDPDFQITLTETTSISSYAPSYSGRESSSSGGGSGMGPSSSLVVSASNISMTSNATRLNIILTDPTLRDLFKSFLKQNICEENLSFYLDVFEFKNKFSTLISSAKAYFTSVQEKGEDANGATPPPVALPAALRDLEKQICVQAFSIYETYLLSGAQREVNLPHQMRQDVTGYMQAVIRSLDNPEREHSGSTSVSRANGGIVSNGAMPSSQPSSPPATPLVGGSESIRYELGAGKDGPQELIHVAMFDTIHDHIFRLMSTDSVPKFTKTDKYREVMMNRVKQNHQALANAASMAVVHGGSYPSGNVSAVGNGSSSGSSSVNGSIHGSVSGNGGSVALPLVESSSA